MEKLVGKWVKRTCDDSNGFEKGKWYLVTGIRYECSIMVINKKNIRLGYEFGGKYFDFANPRSYNPNKEILLSAGNLVTVLEISTVVISESDLHRYDGFITHINGEAVGDRAIITQAMLDEGVANKVSPNKDDKLCTYMGLIGLLYENGISLNLSTKDGFGIVSTRHAVFKCSEKWVTLSGVAEFLTVGQIKEFVAEYGRGTLEPKQPPKEQPETVPTTADNIHKVLAYNGWYSERGDTLHVHNGYKHSSINISTSSFYIAILTGEHRIETPNFDVFLAFLTSVAPLKELPTKVDYLSAVQSGWWVKATKTVECGSRVVGNRIYSNRIYSNGITSGEYYQVVRLRYNPSCVEIVDNGSSIWLYGLDYFDWSTTVADKPSED